jgi:hypothetical protein
VPCSQQRTRSAFSFWTRGCRISIVQVAPQRDTGDLERAADLLDGVAGIGVKGARSRNLHSVERPPLPSLPATGARHYQSRLHPLANQVALERGQCAKDMKDQLPSARRRTNALGQTLEANALRLQRC